MRHCQSDRCLLLLLLAFPADIGRESRLRRPVEAGNAYTPANEAVDDTTWRRQ